MFSEPIVFPHADGNQSLRRINQDSYSSEYLKKNTLDEYRMKIRHSTVKKDGVSYDRHNVEVVQTIYATATIPQFTRKAYFVVELLPSDGDVKLMDALADWAIATSDAALTQLNQGES